MKGAAIFFPRWEWLLAAGLGFTATGCVERLLQVRTEPPGATVYVNGDEVGTTAADGTLNHEFTFYGTVDVAVRAPRYLSHREPKNLFPPWYEVFPVDFFAEVLLPWTIEDVHTVEVQLIPSPSEMDESQRQELRQKAEEHRASLSSGS